MLGCADDIWVIPVEELDHTSNVCLMSDNPTYKARKPYDKWRDKCH